MRSTLSPSSAAPTLKCFATRPKQSRRHDRIPIWIPVILRTDERRVEGIATDLSATGVRIHTAYPLPLHAEVRVQLELPGGALSLTLVASIRSVSPPSEGGTCTLGAEFLCERNQDEAVRQLFRRISLDLLPGRRIVQSQN